MIQQRMKEEDCNAGAIFDNLESSYWPTLKFALESICEALPTQNIQVILLQIPKETGEVPPTDIEESKDDPKPKEFSKEE